jgi:predicted HTH domain antitoxin
MSAQQITIEIPQDIMENLTARELIREVKCYLAVKYYQEEALTIGKAAELAGMNRMEFELFLARNDSPRPEGRGIVGLQGMDIMRVHTPTNKTMPGPNALKGGVWTRRQNQIPICLLDYDDIRADLDKMKHKSPFMVILDDLTTVPAV